MKARWLSLAAILAFSSLGLEGAPAHAFPVHQNVIMQESAPITEVQWHRPGRHCRWVNVRVRGAHGRWFWRRVWRCW